MNPTEKKEFIVEDPKTYKFLSNGNLPVPGVNDAQEFEDTKEAMNIMGMTEEEQGCKSCDLHVGPLLGHVMCMWLQV